MQLTATSNAAKCVQMGSASIIVPITFMSSGLIILRNGIFIGDMRGRIVQRTQFVTNVQLLLCRSVYWHQTRLIWCVLLTNAQRVCLMGSSQLG